MGEQHQASLVFLCTTLPVQLGRGPEPAFPNKSTGFTPSPQGFVPGVPSTEKWLFAQLT